MAEDHTAPGRRLGGDPASRHARTGPAGLWHRPGVDAKLGASGAHLKTSLIVTTYNRPDALALALRSAFGQRLRPDEILVADDGSRDETRALVQAIARDAPVPVVHCWQPDD